MQTNLLIATDHRGKWLMGGLIAKLNERSAGGNLKILDLGGSDIASDDYPLQASKLARKMQELPMGQDIQNLGILICGSGLGILMAANKHRDIRASLYLPGIDYKFERAEHNSNVLVVAADNFSVVKEITDEFDKQIEKLVSDIMDWLAGNHTAATPRYKRRVKQLKLIELTQNAGYPLIVPAVLTADEQVFKSVISTQRTDTPILNFDFIDGSLVSGRTISIEAVLPDLQSYQGLISIHSMNRDVEAEAALVSTLPNLVYFYIQVEAGLGQCQKIAETEYSFLPVLSINATTELTEEIIALAKKFQAVQFMTVEAGAQGRAFLPSCLDKITQLRSAGFSGEIHLDGGINSENIALIKTFAPDVCNVGSGYSTLVRVNKAEGN
jgi:ribose 5-phosphate isomerase B